MKDIPAETPAALAAANGPVHGATGAGKTALLEWLIYQLFALHDLGVRPMSVVVIDHKGSHEVFDRLKKLLNERSEK